MCVWVFFTLSVSPKSGLLILSFSFTEFLLLNTIHDVMYKC